MSEVPDQSRRCQFCGLALALAGGEPDLHGLAPAAVAAAAHGRRAVIVEADGHAQVGLGRAQAVGGVETDPAQPVNEGFGPGVGGRLLLAVEADQVARDVAGRDAAPAGQADEQVGEVLADAGLAMETPRRRWSRRRWFRARR